MDEKERERDRVRKGKQFGEIYASVSVQFVDSNAMFYGMLSESVSSPFI